MTCKLQQLTLILFFFALWAGCVPYTIIEHDYDFVGPTQNLDGQNFFYVEFGVSGSASAQYDFWGGGELVEGLIAEAKRDLMLSHPLKPNQYYSNFSIDKQRKESGTRRQSVSLSSKFSYRRSDFVEWKVTVSADVLELGSPPPDYQVPTPASPKQEVVKVTKGDRATYNYDGGSAECVVLTYPKEGEVKIFIYSTKERVWVSENSLTKSK